MQAVIEVTCIPAHYSRLAGISIPAAFLATVVQGPRGYEGIQCRWHDRQGAVSEAINELPESLRKTAKVIDA